MENRLDILHLNEHKIAEVIKKSLPKDVKSSKNILTVQDDVLFVWNSVDCCVLTLNLRYLRNQSSEQTNYQTILGTKPISFDVELIRVNSVSSLIALAGPNGVCVIELGPRIDNYAGFSYSKEIIYCRNHLLDERLFSCSRFVECKQVKWHPGSPNDNHLLVLTSDNMIRVYRIENGEAITERVWTVGKKPIGIMGNSRVPILVALGETGVDFDFGPPEVTKNRNKYPVNCKQWELLEWPIFILRGNGDIYTIVTKLYNDLWEDAELCGPLSMQPAADDNYGVDACAIICLQSTPPVIAISTCTGTIYHCVVLTAEDNDDLVVDWKSEESNLPDKSLYVFESIELELGLSLSDKEDLGHTCPIFFHHDAVSKSRYFCTHDTGVHAITISLVNQLEEFVSSTDNIEDSLPHMNEPSTAEYLICTHATSSDINPVLGIAMLYNPGTLIALLGSGQIISLPLVSVLLPTVNLEKEEIEDSDIVSPTKKILKQPFDEYIKTFLKPNLTQPILKLGGINNNYKECYELFYRATETFRTEHFKKLERVREEIEKRVKALQLLKEYQQKELKRLEREKEYTKEFAEKLAEKYEDIKDKQEELSKRAENLLRLVNQKQPTQIKAEKELEKSIKADFEKLEYFKKMFDQIRRKQKYQADKIQAWRNQQKKNEKQLGTIQTNTIKSTLSMMTQQIGELKKDIFTCKKELGLA